MIMNKGKMTGEYMVPKKMIGQCSQRDQLCYNDLSDLKDHTL